MWIDIHVVLDLTSEINLSQKTLSNTLEDVCTSTLIKSPKDVLQTSGFYNSSRQDEHRENSAKSQLQKDNSLGGPKNMVQGCDFFLIWLHVGIKKRILRFEQLACSYPSNSLR